jgi:hypothetical protein
MSKLKNTVKVPLSGENQVDEFVYLATSMGYKCDPFLVNGSKDEIRWGLLWGLGDYSLYSNPILLEETKIMTLDELRAFCGIAGLEDKDNGSEELKTPSEAVSVDEVSYLTAGWGDTEYAIYNLMNDIRDKVIQKNIDYCDSLQNPETPLFSVDRLTGIMGRINDKLNRLRQVGLNDTTEDTVEDLIGYFVHLLIANEKQSIDNDKKN